MRCGEVEELLLDHVEGTLDPPQAAAVRSHLDGCQSCRDQLAEMSDLVSALGDARAATLASGTTLRPGGMALAAAWQPGTRLGDFEIQAELGRGGMGIVYRARQTSLNRIVALKVLPGLAAQSPKAVQRFRTEAQAAAKMHHTNIVAVYSQGEHDGNLYYVMELIDGVGLDRAMQSDAGLGGAGDSAVDLHRTHGRTGRNFRRIARLVSEVADGLEHAHRQGVVHRDIKPQNLLLGRDGHLHITDFGLARLYEEPGVTVTGEMLGTPAYMSPEQVTADRRRIDHRTDIYSLGVTLYELLTGRRPFEGVTREQVLARIATGSAVAPRTVQPHIPVDLETICLRSIEHNPAHRYRTAAELAADLRRFAENVPIRARRAGPIEKAVKWVRRHPAATGIAALCAALVIGATLYVRQALHARHERANRLVQEAFDLVTYFDYHDYDKAARLLADAAQGGANADALARTQAIALIFPNAAEADRRLSQLLERHGDVELLCAQAWALDRLEETARLKECYDHIDALGGPKTAAGKLHYGLALQRKSPERAAEQFRDAMAMRPRFAQAMVQYARARNQWTYHFRQNVYFDDVVPKLETVCNMLLPDEGYPKYVLSLAYFWSADICDRSGQADLARQRFDKALEWARRAETSAEDPRYGFQAEADYWQRHGDYPAAIAALTRALDGVTSVKSRDELQQYRWRLHFWAGDYPAALADLHAIAARHPSSSGGAPDLMIWFHLSEGLIAAEQGRLQDAIDQTVDSVADLSDRPAARVEAAWLGPRRFRTVLAAATLFHILGRADLADRTLGHSADRFDASDLLNDHSTAEWEAALRHFCRDETALESLRVIASKTSDDKWLWAPAWLYDGARRLGRGDRAGARQRFQQAAECYDQEDFCYIAGIFLGRMKAEPAWPAWIPQHP